MSAADFLRAYNLYTDGFGVEDIAVRLFGSSTEANIAKVKDALLQAVAYSAGSH